MIELKIVTKELKCRCGVDSSFSCKFTDKQGIKREIEDITFLNLNLVGARNEFYKDKTTHEACFNISFEENTICEVMGTTESKNIVVNCRRL